MALAAGRQGPALERAGVRRRRIATGPARVINDVSELDQFQPGEVLVAEMTDPDWEPVIKMAAAVVTDRGGRTCHAAIVAREIGIPSVVGCRRRHHRACRTGDEVTVSCAEGGEGRVYAGAGAFTDDAHRPGRPGAAAHQA